MEPKPEGRGLSLVEILIAVAIVAVATAVAIPNIINARVQANERAAIQTLNSVHLALETYLQHDNADSPTYPASIRQLIEATPSYLAGNNIEITSEAFPFIYFECPGYRFVYHPISNTYYCIATPLQFGISGNRIFKIEQHGRVDLFDLDTETWSPLY